MNPKNTGVLLSLECCWHTTSVTMMRLPLTILLTMTGTLLLTTWLPHLILEGETLLCDSKRVVDIIKPFVIEGPRWPFCQSFNSRKQQMFVLPSSKALKSQAEGRCAIATRNTKAYAMVTSSIISGKKGKFVFDHYAQYVRRRH